MTGNVRELQHTLEYAFIICKKAIITKEDLPSEFGSMDSTNRQHEKDDIERDSIIQALVKTGWNRAKAARLLGNWQNSTLCKDLEVSNHGESHRMKVPQRTLLFVRTLFSS